MSANSVAPGAQQKRFAAYLDRLAHAAGHLDRAVPLKSYCTGLLLPGERKSVEPMAARLCPDNVRFERYTSPDSSVVCSSISSGATYSKFLWKGETLFRVSLVLSHEGRYVPHSARPQCEHWASRDPYCAVQPHAGLAQDFLARRHNMVGGEIIGQKMLDIGTNKFQTRVLCTRRALY
jgi:hypothetical protein